MGRPTLNVGSAFPWAGITEGKGERPEHPRSPLSASLLRTQCEQLPQARPATPLHHDRLTVPRNHEPEGAFPSLNCSCRGFCSSQESLIHPTARSRIRSHSSCPAESRTCQPSSSLPSSPPPAQSQALLYFPLPRHPLFQLPHGSENIFFSFLVSTQLISHDVMTSRLICDAEKGRGSFSSP